MFSSTPRSWYVTRKNINEPQSMHGFIKILRSANLFHQIQDYFQFHNYENGRDAVNGGRLLSFKITPPFPHTHKLSHHYANEYISVPFLKDPHLATVRALREGRVQKKSIIVHMALQSKIHLCLLKSVISFHKD